MLDASLLETPSLSTREQLPQNTQKEKIGRTMQAVKINNMIHRTFISKLIITYSHVLSKSFWNRNWWISDDWIIDQKYYIKTVTCWQICKCWICNWIRHVIIEVPIFSELSFTLGRHLVQEKNTLKKFRANMRNNMDQVWKIKHENEGTHIWIKMNDLNLWDYTLNHVIIPFLWKENSLFIMLVVMKF